MGNILVASHSGLRWIVLLLLLLAIIRAFARKSSGRYEKSDKMINLFAMVFVHIQVTIGIILAFINQNGRISYASGWMGNDQKRFFGMEHILLMLIAVVVLTIGRKKGEQLSISNPSKAHNKIAVWFTVALILILAGIPWPFRGSLGIEGWM